MCFVSLLSISI
ncbi:hypothetical protein Pint_06407 [Pistacia integerrima]|uniref:Uncharacterized protein n=1 Tax=Pistacia integerrima TaxID=434235 RepID=A0ACC0Z7Q2_9ROSI|nr:hypothetical protein Pint_06407 [Pistacia integerrima]